MEVLDQLARVEQSETFRAWRSSMPKAYLSTLFVMIDGEHREWLAGFYDPDSERTTSFTIGDEIALIPPAATFKEPESTVLQLDPGMVRCDLGESLAIAAARQQQEFPIAAPRKIIAILQHLPLGVVYNITYVTAALSTLNIKVDAATKAVHEAKLIPIISFAR